MIVTAAAPVEVAVPSDPEPPVTPSGSVNDSVNSLDTRLDPAIRAFAPESLKRPPEHIFLGRDNATGRFNEWLQNRYGLDVGAPIFRESYESFGPAHRLTHRCNFVVHSEDMGLRKAVTSDYCVNVKAAKKHACALMHEWFLSREADPTAPYPPPPPGRGGQAVEAMIGDAVLKLLLVQHHVDHHRFESNGRDEPDPGPLNQAGTNKFLYQRHIQLSRECALPRGLPPPKGHAHADPTAFEAWIARVFEERGRSLVECAKAVLPALGVEPPFLFDRNPNKEDDSSLSDSDDDMDAETPDDEAENAVEVIDAAVDEAIDAAVEASCETEGEGVEVEPEA